MHLGWGQIPDSSVLILDGGNESVCMDILSYAFIFQILCLTEGLACCSQW